MDKIDVIDIFLDMHKQLLSEKAKEYYYKNKDKVKERNQKRSRILREYHRKYYHTVRKYDSDFQNYQKNYKYHTDISNDSDVKKPCKNYSQILCKVSRNLNDLVVEI